MRSRPIAVAVLAAALAACTGGGGGPPVVSMSARSEPPPPDNPAAALSPRDWQAWTDELSGRSSRWARPGRNGPVSVGVQVESWPTTNLAFHRAQEALRASSPFDDGDGSKFSRETIEKAKAAMERFRADLVRVRALKAQGRGYLTAPGIDRIPLNAVKVTNAQMAKWFAISEGRMPNDPKHLYFGGHTGPHDGEYYGTDHADSVAEIACHSYITACEDPFREGVPFHVRGYHYFFSHFDPATGDPPRYC